MALLCGVDVGSRAVRALVVRTGIKRTFVVERAIAVPVTVDPSGATARDDVVAAIRAVVAQLPPNIDEVHAALPGDQVVTRVVDLPEAAARRIDQVLPFELEGNTAIDVADSQVDHQPHGAPADRATKKIRLLAAVVPKSRIAERLALYAEGGLDPRELAESALALGELQAVIPPSPDGLATAVVDLGHDRTDVVVFRSGGPEACRTLSRAGRQVTHALVKELGLSASRAEEAKAAVGLDPRPDLGPEHAVTVKRVRDAIRQAVDPLVRDLRQTLAAYRASSGVTVGQIVLTGGGALTLGLKEHIAGELGIPTIVFAFPLVTGAPEPDEAPLWGKALGLALRGTVRAKRIDFRKGSFAPKSDTRQARGVVLGTAAWVAVLALAWGFSAFARYSVLESESESQVEQLRALSKQLLGEEIDDFVRAQALVKGSSGAGDPTPQMDAFAALDELSRRIPREITHDLDDLDIRPDRVTMRGQVTSLTDVDSLYTALSEVDCFGAIEKGRTTRTVDGSRQKYNLEITVRCPDAEGGEDGPAKATKAGARRRDDTAGEGL